MFVIDKTLITFASNLFVIFFHGFRQNLFLSVFLVFAFFCLDEQTDDNEVKIKNKVNNNNVYL